MIKILFALALAAAIADSAAAQGGAAAGTPDYPSAAAALQALRVKPGVNISVQSGWTVVEDGATLSVWSFTPAGHRAHPAAVKRRVVQQGSNFLVETSVLCQAAKPDCDALLADFEKLNERARDDLARPRR
jgi:hypothetical protein